MFTINKYTSEMSCTVVSTARKVAEMKGNCARYGNAVWQAQSLASRAEPASGDGWAVFCLS